jgi:hypothetical protein
VGSQYNTDPTLTGTAITLADSPATDGDLLVLLVHIVNSTDTVSTVTGGGVTSWTLDQRYADTFPPSTHHDTEIWQGKVTSTGAHSIAITFSGSLTDNPLELYAQEFTAGASTTWTEDTGAGLANAGPSLDFAFPSLTPVGSHELYFGYAWVPGTATGGVSPLTATFVVTAATNLIFFDPNVSAPEAPVGAEDSDSFSASIGVLIQAS